MWKLRLRPRYSFSGNICFEISVFCLFSVLYNAHILFQTAERKAWAGQKEDMGREWTQRQSTSDPENGVLTFERDQTVLQVAMMSWSLNRDQTVLHKAMKFWSLNRDQTVLQVSMMSWSLNRDQTALQVAMMFWSLNRDQTVLQVSMMSWSLNRDQTALQVAMMSWSLNRDQTVLHVAMIPWSLNRDQTVLNVAMIPWYLNRDQTVPHVAIAPWALYTQVSNCPICGKVVQRLVFQRIIAQQTQLDLRFKLRPSPWLQCSNLNKLAWSELFSLSPYVYL